MEKVKSLKFLGVHITDLKWSHHTDTVVKKAQQHHFNLRWLKKFGKAPSHCLFTLLPSSRQRLYRCRAGTETETVSISRHSDC